LLNVSAGLSHSFHVLWPEADNILSWNLVYAELVTITAESVANCSTVVTKEVARCFVLAAEPELLVTLKESVVIEEFAVKHGKTTSIDVYFTKKISCFLHCFGRSE
jgi:hypothetical protein